MTAFYMFRLVYLTFHGHPRMGHDVEHHIHESPKSMTVPLMILAFFALFAGFLGWPHSLGGRDRFEAFLHPVFARDARVFRTEGEAGQLAAGKKEEHTDPMEYGLMFLSVGAALAGWGMARRSYSDADKGLREPLAAKVPPLYTVLLNKYYVDEGYDYVFTGRRKIGNVRLGVMGLGEGVLMGRFARDRCGGERAGWMTRVLWKFRVGGTNGLLMALA